MWKQDIRLIATCFDIFCNVCAIFALTFDLLDTHTFDGCRYNQVLRNWMPLRRRKTRYTWVTCRSPVRPLSGLSVYLPAVRSQVRDSSVAKNMLSNSLRKKQTNKKTLLWLFKDYRCSLILHCINLHLFQ